ncbi:MAG: hypothetical protein AB4426_10140 [Xenococcaceae cyanobacterium]
MGGGSSPLIGFKWNGTVVREQGEQGLARLRRCSAERSKAKGKRQKAKVGSREAGEQGEKDFD